MSRLKLSQYDTDNTVSAGKNRQTARLSGPFTSGYRAAIMLFFILFSFLFNAAQAAVNTGLSGDDRYAGRFPIGFEFQYYDKTYSRFYVSTNGLIQFSKPTTQYNNQCLPAKFNDTLYVFWDDLRTDVKGQPSGKIEYQTLGEAPNRKLVIQWTNQYFFGSNLPMGTFQAVLFEGTNQIKYQYRNLLDDRSHGNSATIGIQGPIGQFKQISCNLAGALTPGQAIAFTPTADKTGYIVDTNAEYDFIDISGFTMDYPMPIARYTNQAPGWEWLTVSSLNNYQIDVQNLLGESLHQETVGNVNAYRYDAGVQHGQSYRAKIRGSINNGGTWEAWSGLSAPTTVDLVKPVAKLNAFDLTSPNTATVAYQASDDLSGVRSVQLQIASDADFTQVMLEAALPVNRANYSVNQLPQNERLFARVKSTDNAGNVSDYSAVIELALAAPAIITPVNGTQFDQPTVTVTGTSYPNSSVQLYLDDVAVSTPVAVDENGYFSTEITLDNEQSYRLTAKAQTQLGESPLSYEVVFTYQVAPATIVFATPSAGAALTTSTAINVVASDRTGISQVDIYDGETLLTSLTEAPYSVMWQLSASDNGPHTLKAVVTAGNGKIYEARNSVEVNVLPPVLPPTPYTGLINAVTPSVSYGQPIVIEGQAIERASSQLMTNVPLQLVLTNNGFKRTIAISSDDNGLFSYRFIPQSTDKGAYGVTVIHPRESVTPPQAEFTINRINFHIDGYNLTAARHVQAQIVVKATADAGARDVYWTLRAEDQPNGQLPQGITVSGGNPITIAAGTETPTSIYFTADDSAAETGSLFLVALANESGSTVRGKLQINYRLTQAQPALYTTPSFIQSGLAQGDSITETLTLANRGLIAAENVQLTLLDHENNAAPDWVFIASQTEAATVNVGDALTLNVVAQPDNGVADGIYTFYLHVRADNQASFSVPIAISVVQNGIGGIRFDVADIYTATLDDSGQPILGVANATIKLQNDTVLTEQYTLKTDANGIAVADQLPPGIYLYRASAPMHNDAAGRVRVRPGVTSSEHIFLNYEVINVEFSVTETTVKDEYEVQIDATYNTQVPAPVVLFEPLSISLNGMQIGEIKTGQLTLTNYGLVRADNIKLTLPESDDKFSYEFFGEIPTQLAPKSRIVIPYKITKLAPKPIARARSARSLAAFAPMSAPSGSGQCSSYTKRYSESHSYQCANGDEGNGSNGGSFTEISGNCGSSSPGIWEGLPPGSGNGGSGSGLSQPMPLAPSCNKDCTGICCFFSGSKAANG